MKLMVFLVVPLAQSEICPRIALGIQSEHSEIPEGCDNDLFNYALIALNIA